MTMKAAFWFLSASALALASCRAAPTTDDVPSSLAEYVLTAPPEMKNTTFIDFGSKVHLIGYDISPDGPAAPGAELKVTLYWKSVAKLDPGWGLFLHLLDDRGRRIGNFDNDGPLRTWQDSERRQALPPSLWEPGLVYVDPVTVVPRDASGTISLVTGVWHDGMRLPVLSGPTDGHDAGIVTHLDTGVAARRRSADVSLSKKK
jgi:hypothetical protein